MNRIKNKLIFFLLAILATPMIESCGPSQADQDQLTGFMLGGIHFIEGYGGMGNLVNLVDIHSVGKPGTPERKLLDGFTTYLTFPYDQSQQADLAGYLKELWKIGNKEELEMKIEELIKKEEGNKAWDYARIVNLSASGYAAKYLSKEEVLKIHGEILPMVRKEYADWEKYFEDYKAGLKAWNGTSNQAKESDELIKEVLTHEKSIYKLMPLN